MATEELRIGTRGSALALAQARLATEALAAAGVSSRLVIVETDGDRRAPDTAWGEGAFVKAIERALLDEEVDVAVHSAKDVPTDEDRRLRTAAYLPRADARDALVVRAGERAGSLAELPEGARVGTDSPRRTGFVLAQRPDLRVHPLHGNVDTRLRRLDSGETDALVLACAGLDRLGRGERIAVRIAPRTVPPAPGQGAIALQVRAADEATARLVGTADDPETRAAVEAERAFLAASGGGCRAPIGAYAEVVGEDLRLLGGHASPDGRTTRVREHRGARADPAAVGRALAERVADGAARRLAALPRVLVTRAAEHAGELVEALRESGADAVVVPAIAVEAAPAGGPLDEAVGRLSEYAVVVLASANGARALVDAARRTDATLSGPRWAAVGVETARVLQEAGIGEVFTPARNTGFDLAAEVPLRRGERVLIARGDLGDASLGEHLAQRGAIVDEVVGYRTIEAPTASRALLAAAIDAGPLAAAVYTSGSTVRGALALASAQGLDIRGIPAVCIGASTAKVARTRGLDVAAIAASPDASGLVRAVAGVVGTRPREMA